MESFVVRIYRRNDDQDSITGIVEIVDRQQERPFKNHEELLEILNLAKDGAAIVWEKK